MRVFAIALICTVIALANAQAPGRAYRDINFGDSFDTVANKIFADDAFLNGYRPVSQSMGSAKSPREWLSWGMGVDTRLSGDRYSVDFQFYDDKLYRIEFVSDGETAEYFDTTVKGLRDKLVEVISGARGEPTRVLNAGFFDMEAGYTTRTHIWDTNADGIAYFIGLAKSEYRYYAVLSIEWTWLRELKDSVDADRESERIRQSQDDF